MEACTQKYIHTHIWIHIYIHIVTQGNTHICISIYVCACKHAHTNIYIHTYRYMCTYIHSYTRKHTHTICEENRQLNGKIYLYLTKNLILAHLFCLVCTHCTIDEIYRRFSGFSMPFIFTEYIPSHLWKFSPQSKTCISFWI